MDGPHSPWLIPDTYSFNFQHILDTSFVSYEDFYPCWQNKIGHMFWRGSTTGISLEHPAKKNLRVRVCDQMLSCTASDIKISNICQVANAEKHRDELSNAGIIGDAVRPERFNDYKYYPDLPGNSMSWGSIRNHVYGALVFRPSFYSDSFYKDAGLLWHKKMLPWKHYIPVGEDFSDLANKLEWALLNDDQAALIAWNGMICARKYLRELEDILLCRLQKSPSSLSLVAPASR